MTEPSGHSWVGSEGRGITEEGISVSLGESPLLAAGSVDSE